MKVKITEGRAWYNGMEGVVFEVDEVDRKYDGLSGVRYFIDPPNTKYDEGRRFIREENCEVVADQPQPLAEAYPKYYKDVSGVDSVDVYAVHRLFAIDDPSGAIHHASKKLLLSGVRTGGKSKYDDVKEARDTLDRWLAMNDEKDAD